MTQSIMFPRKDDKYSQYWVEKKNDQKLGQKKMMALLKLPQGTRVGQMVTGNKWSPHVIHSTWSFTFWSSLPVKTLPSSPNSCSKKASLSVLVEKVFSLLKFSKRIFFNFLSCPRPTLSSIIICAYIYSWCYFQQNGSSLGKDRDYIVLCAYIFSAYNSTLHIVGVYMFVELNWTTWN